MVQLLTSPSDLLNPNVDGPDESQATSALDELIAKRSKDAQKNREELDVDKSIGHSPDAQVDGGQGAAELEAEAQGEGAFNPETGEINWDCPCLGGMAHGPCGPQFREAFSCFVYSEQEPKGMDCIEKFQGMRDCFQEHPEVYKDELMEDEELDAELEAEKQDLVNQIAERRKAEESANGHRLLEEATPALKSANSAPSDDSKAPTQSPQPQTTTRSRSTEDSSKAPRSRPQLGANTTASTDASMKPERENVIEGQHSNPNKDASPPPVISEALPESDSLIPKAAHDARGSVGPAGQPAKKE